MELKINLLKRHVFFLVFLIIIGFAGAQVTNPGHLSSDIWVPAGVSGTAQTLDSFLSWLNTQVTNHAGRINSLEVANPHAEVGAEIYIGSGTSSAVGLRVNEIPLLTYNAIQRVRIHVTGTSGMTVGPFSCPDIILDSSNGYQMSCAAGGQISFVSTGAQCDTPANVDWITFDLYGLNPSSYKSGINSDGISKLYSIVCDDSPNSGSVTFDLYVTPYAHRIDSRRIHPYIPGNNPLTITQIQGN